MTRELVKISEFVCDVLIVIQPREKVGSYVLTWSLCIAFTWRPRYSKLQPSRLKVMSLWIIHRFIDS